MKFSAVGYRAAFLMHCIYHNAIKCTQILHTVSGTSFISQISCFCYSKSAMFTKTTVPACQYFCN